MVSTCVVYGHGQYMCDSRQICMVSTCVVTDKYGQYMCGDRVLSISPKPKAPIEWPYLSCDGDKYCTFQKHLYTLMYLGQYK